MIVGIIFGIVCVVSISNAVRKYNDEKEKTEALRNECAHHIHDRNMHHIHDR